LRAILQAGGSIDHHWPVTKAFETADRATGTHVVMRMYSEMAEKAMHIDLQELWRKLGISRVNGGITFNNDAPLSAIRDSIISPIG
jgi:hypothetical protein